MIMIKIIILYFIQIRHTDDFSSTGTRLVIVILTDIIIVLTNKYHYINSNKFV